LQFLDYSWDTHTHTHTNVVRVCKALMISKHTQENLRVHTLQNTLQNTMLYLGSKNSRKQSGFDPGGPGDIRSCVGSEIDCGSERRQEKESHQNTNIYARQSID